MLLRMLTTALAAVLFSGTALAAGDAAAARERIREALAPLGPKVHADDIQPTPVDGLYSVVVGARVVYVSADGKYLFNGDLIDLGNRQSLTERAERKLRLKRLNALGDDSMVVFEPKGKVEHEITVFTDIDCPYCRRLHAHMDGYLSRGIRVRYLSFPRAGIHSSSYDKLVWAWCADSPQKAITREMNGQAVPRRECDNPVKRDYALARELGVNATPTIITDTGTMVSGYRGPDAMLKLLNRDKDDSAGG